MTFYTTAQVREIASNASYKEINCNTGSKVISFRQNSTRINVYYTTGTVGTCLNHPRKGKTQLFRRLVPLQQLEDIFLDPRSHTGKGYYRKNPSQWWKTIDGNGVEHFEPDSSRRWKFVLAASGLSQQSREIDQVANFFKKLDSFYWDEGTVPRMSAIKYTCGVLSAVTLILLDVINDVMGDGDSPISVYKFHDVELYRMGEISRDDVEEKVDICECANLVWFMDNFERDMNALESQLRKFRRDIQIELCQWIVSRNICGYCFFSEDSLEMVESKFTYRVFDAHEQYADLVYTKNMKVCKTHGVCEN